MADRPKPSRAPLLQLSCKNEENEGESGRRQHQRVRRTASSLSLESAGGSVSLNSYGAASLNSASTSSSVSYTFSSSSSGRSTSSSSASSSPSPRKPPTRQPGQPGSSPAKPRSVRGAAKSSRQKTRTSTRQSRPPAEQLRYRLRLANAKAVQESRPGRAVMIRDRGRALAIRAWALKHLPGAVEAAQINTQIRKTLKFKRDQRIPYNELLSQTTEKKGCEVVVEKCEM